MTDGKSTWPQEIRNEMEREAMNGCVGSQLVSETDKVRVWHLSIPVGRRCKVHRHVLNYFWTAHNAGLARNYFEDGRTVDTVHYKGETKHLSFGKDEYMLHCVENIGDADLLFTTVEFLESPNEPLPVPDEVRLKVVAVAIG